MLIALGEDLNQGYPSTEEPQTHGWNLDVGLRQQALIDAVADLELEREPLNRSSLCIMLYSTSKACLLMDIREQCCGARQQYVPELITQYEG